MKVIRPTASPLSCRRLTSCYWILTTLAAFAIMTVLLTTPFPQTITQSVVKCVNFDSYGQTKEGIGAILRRNQLGLFIADVYSTKIAFPNIISEHGYPVDEMFDKCDKPSPECTLNEAEMVLYRCPRADCKCHREQLYRYTEALASHCSVIGYVNQKVRTMEFSGCTEKPLAKYFGTDREPIVPYDAVHFRAGDLAGRNGGKTFGKHEFYYILKTMCQLSDRDIVIATEGNPEIPVAPGCEGRLVLASDTSIQDVFRIMQHATTVSVGTSSLATMVMEVARPKRIVMLERVLPRYEWVDCEYWTLIGPHGAVFHFNSKALMVDAALKGRELMIRSLRTDNQHSGTKFEMAVPKRRWSNDSSMPWVRKPRQ